MEASIDAKNAKDLEDGLAESSSKLEQEYKDMLKKYKGLDYPVIDPPFEEIPSIDPPFQEIPSTSTNYKRSDDEWVGAHVRFESINYPNLFIRHQNGDLKLHPANYTDKFEDDSRWIVREGLAGDGFSFESFNYPKTYIKHRDGLCYQTSVDFSMSELQDATFFIVEGYQGGQSLQSYNSPNRFIRHQNRRLKLSAYPNADLFKMDASWKIHKV